jgi:hypothetical protein
LQSHHLKMKAQNSTEGQASDEENKPYWPFQRSFILKIMQFQAVCQDKGFPQKAIMGLQAI